MYFHLSGRLGNQLFQWAFAHQLSLHYGEKVSFFIDNIHHRALMNKENQFDLIECSHISSHVQSNTRGIQLAMLDKISTFSPKTANKVEITARFLRTKDSYEIPFMPSRIPSIVSGFYINKRVISGIEELLFTELIAILKKVSIPANLPKNYQVLHVRRGDYLTTDTGYGILEGMYYLDNLDKKLPVVLCTDNALEARDVIDAVSPALVLDPKNSSAWQTLRIMGESQRLIMGNSTLSWWGGFIALFKGGTVIQPEPFYLGNKNGNEGLIFEKFTQKRSYLE